MKKKSISLLAAGAINAGMVSQTQLNQDISDATALANIYVQQLQLLQPNSQSLDAEKLEALKELLQKIQISNELLSSTESEWVREK